MVEIDDKPTISGYKSLLRTKQSIVNLLQLLVKTSKTLKYERYFLK